MTKFKRQTRRAAAAFLAGVMMLTTPYGTGNISTADAAGSNASKIEFVKPDTKTLVLKKGQKYQLKTNVAKKNLIYKSSKSSVVTVSTTGKLKAKKKGSATITVSLKSNKKIKKTLKVKVGTRVKSVKLNVKDVTLKVGETYKINATLDPKNQLLKR